MSKEVLYPGPDATVWQLSDWLKANGWMPEGRGWRSPPRRGTVTSTNFITAIDMQRRREAALSSTRKIDKARKLLGRWLLLTDGDEDPTFEKVREDTIELLGQEAPKTSEDIDQ